MTKAHFRGLGPGSPVGRHVVGELGAHPVLRLAADLLAVAVSFGTVLLVHDLLIPFGLTGPEVVSPSRYVSLVAMHGATLVTVFAGIGLYKPRASLLNLWEVAAVLKGIFVASAILIGAAFVFRIGDLSRFVVAGGLFGSGALILLERRAIAAVLRHRQLSGVIGRRVLIVGTGPTGRLLMKRLIDAPHASRTLIGFLDAGAAIGSTVTCTTDQTTHTVIRRSVLGRPEDLREVVKVFGVDEVLVDEGAVEPSRILELFESAEDLGLAFGLVPRIGDLRADRLELQHISTIPVLRPRSQGGTDGYRYASRVLDVVLATTVLILTAPLWILITVTVKLDSKGPVLFTQERVGIAGRTFRMFKFRSMRTDADAYAPSPKGDQDPRITRTGRFLRMGGIDEIPQVINVLRGEMSLVGPRPEMPFIVAGYTPYERRRLGGLPGITGLWQISPDRHGEIHHNVEYDLYYLDHQSLLLDVLILFETIFRSVEMVVKGVLAHRSDESTSPSVIYSMPAGFELRTPAEDLTPVLDSGNLVLEEPDQWKSDYLLVALEQRGADEGRPFSWQPVLVAAFAVSCRWPVKIIAAESNRAAFNQILEKAKQRMGSGQARIAYVAPGNEWKIRALTASSSLLITDVDVFADWALETGVSCFSYPSMEVQIRADGIAPRAVEEFERWLPGKASKGLDLGHLNMERV